MKINDNLGISLSTEYATALARLKKNSNQELAKLAGYPIRADDVVVVCMGPTTTIDPERIKSAFTSSRALVIEVSSVWQDHDGQLVPSLQYRAKGSGSAFVVLYTVPQHTMGSLALSATQHADVVCVATDTSYSVIKHDRQTITNPTTNLY